VEPSSKLFIEKLLKSFIKSDKSRMEGYNFMLIFEDENRKQIEKKQKLLVNVAHNKEDFKNKTYKKRYFTVTDLFYQAARKSIVDRHVLLVRYPVLNHLNIFPTGINLLSTKKEDKDVYLLYNFNVN